MVIAKSELHMAFERERCTAPETEEAAMTETKPVERAKDEVEQGKRPSTAAGEFVREEMHHIREGKHGARSTKQAIAIGLSKARRAGVPLKPPSTRRTSERTHEAAERDYQIGQGQRKPRAASRMRVAAPRCAAALGERLVLRRSRAERWACCESAAFDAAPRPSRFNAFETARARLRDGARGFRWPWPI